MKTIIKEKFQEMRENADVKDSKEYAELLEKYIAVYEKLRNGLPEEFIDDFNSVISLSEQKESEACDTYFVAGFKLGLLLGIETCN